MPILDIVLYPDSRLREPCQEVETVTDEIRKLLENMAETMYRAPGIGLAASQVGSPHRVIVVDVGEDVETGLPGKLYQLVNPKIIKQSGTTQGEEGCLSIPDVRETVKRASDIVVEALDETGAPVSFSASGLLSICLQHEIDHLDGVLFIDYLSRLKRKLIQSRLRQLEKEHAKRTRSGSDL